MQDPVIFQHYNLDDNAVSCPTSQTIHHTVSYAWIVLHAHQKSENQMTEPLLISLILMRCERHISNGISICHSVLFSTLTPCMRMPNQAGSVGASGAGSTFLVWLRF